MSTGLLQKTLPAHIRQRRGGEPRRLQAHLCCINNFQFNLAPIKKTYFPSAQIQRRHCQTKAAIRGVDILKEDESARNPLFANYGAHISSGWSILCPLRLSNIHNSRRKKIGDFFFYSFLSPLFSYNPISCTQHNYILIVSDSFFVSTNHIKGVHPCRVLVALRWIHSPRHKSLDVNARWTPTTTSTIAECHPAAADWHGNNKLRSFLQHAWCEDARRPRRKRSRPCTDSLPAHIGKKKISFFSKNKPFIDWSISSASELSGWQRGALKKEP